MTRTAGNEQGFASLIVGLIMVLVLSLLTVGYAQLVRNEQRSTLDKQLSTQAFYAAESGVNDVIKNLASIPSTGYDTCNGFSAATGINPKIDAANNVSYTCALVNLTPPELDYSDIPLNGSYAVKFTSQDSTGAAKVPPSITVSWQCNDDNVNPATKDCGPFNKSLSSSAAFAPSGQGTGTWDNTTGAIELSITPLSDSSYTRPALLADEDTIILYPSNSGTGTIAYSKVASDSGSIVGGNCKLNSTYNCSVTITGLAATGDTQYLLRLQSLYSGTKARVTLGNNYDFSGGQAIIDVTGKAQDVLKRIQVAVPLTPATSFPGTVINAGDAICKDFNLYSGFGKVADPACADPNIPQNTTPTPPGGGGGGGAGLGGNGCDPSISTCAVHKKGDGGTYVWNTVLHNLSNNPSLTVKQCIINYDDGSGDHVYPANAQQCQTYAGGQAGSIPWDYTNTSVVPANYNTKYPYPLECGNGTPGGKVVLHVTLKMEFTNAPTAPATYTVRLPNCS